MYLGSEAQVSWELRIKLTTEDSAKVSSFNYQSVFISENERQTELDNILLRFYSQGFLTANYISKVEQDSILTATLSLGQPYNWVHMDRGNVPPEVFADAGFREVNFLNKPFTEEAFTKLMDGLLTYYENHGYPFAEINLDSITVKNEGIAARFNLNKHQQVVIDSFIIIGKSNLKRSYIYNYLDIKPGDLYNEADIRKIDKRLRALPFIKLIVPTRVFFYEKGARIILAIDDKKADQIDGIIGFAPNTASSSPNERLLLTGELHLKLQNILGSGKGFELNWRSFLERSQELNTRLQLPYFAGTKAGLDLGFELLKFDTLYLNVNTDLGVQYLFNGTDYAKFYLNTLTTSLLSVDTGVIRATERLPATSALRTNIYGIQLNRQNLDYRFNPRSGYDLSVDIGIGKKRIRRDPKIEQVKFNEGGTTYSVYDSVELVSTQYRLGVNFRYFLPIKQRSTFMTGIYGKHLVANQIFFNELYRFGGLKTLRGFDEQSIFASSFTILTLEYRYLMGENSFFQVFWNGAYYEDRNEQQTKTVTDTPYGFGAGLNFETSSGIFTIAYALGTQKNNPIELRAAKVHFGIINYF